MPNRPMRPCKHYGCRELVQSGYCKEHENNNKTKRNKDIDSKRLNANQRGYTYRWQKERLIFLQKNPLCVHCLEAGRLTPANIVDHIVPHKCDTNLFWDKKNNWQALCKKCHDIKTLTEDSDWKNCGTIYYPYNIPKLIIPLNVVCGPIASGKSTYIQNNKGDKDYVIDVDEIISQISGLSIYEADFNIYVDEAIVERNTRLAKLTWHTEYKKVWLAATSASKWQRDYWRDRYQATVYVLETDVDECIKRMNQDKRRHNNNYNLKEKEILIRSWWKKYQRSDDDIIIM